MCCSSGCALDDARVWTADACTAPSELSPVETLPLRATQLRVSLNGQQYSNVEAHSPTRDPHAPSPLSPALLDGAAASARNASARVATGFTYYSASQLRLSAVTPTRGPVAGGTLVTLTGRGFVDLGARVGFVGAGSVPANASLVSASVAAGMLRGRVVTCLTPPSAAGLPGVAHVELSLNGEAGGDSMTDGNAIRFEYVAEAGMVGEGGNGEGGSGDDLGSGSGA